MDAGLFRDSMQHYVLSYVSFCGKQGLSWVIIQLSVAFLEDPLTAAQKLLFVAKLRVVCLFLWHRRSVEDVLTVKPITSYGCFIGIFRLYSCKFLVCEKDSSVCPEILISRKWN